MSLFRELYRYAKVRKKYGIAALMALLACWLALVEYFTLIQQEAWKKKSCQAQQQRLDQGQGNVRNIGSPELEGSIRKHWDSMSGRRRTHARRTCDVLRPLFPGYLFVQVNPEIDRWRPMLSTFGVRSVLRCGDRLSFIDDAFIESLKAREIDGVITRPSSPYQVGQEVRLSGGAFDGMVATIIDMDERDRLTVLMDLLNRPVRVKVDERQIAPV